MLKKKNDLSAQEFLNVEAIENKILWSRDKLLYAYIRVRGQDNSLLGERENEQITEHLTVTLSKQTENLQIISIPRTVDTAGMIQELKALRQDTRVDARLRLIGGEIAALEEMAADGAKEPLIIIKIWKAAAPNADRVLLDRASLLASQLTDNKIYASVMDDEEILHLCTIYAELGIWQDVQIDSDIPTLKGKKRIFTRKKEEDPAHAQLMEQITPVGGLLFYPDWLMLGNAYCKCYGVTRYPATMDYNWAALLTNSTDCITCITYYPGCASEIGDALSRAVRSSSRGAAEERDVRQRKRLERTAEDADNLIDDLDARSKALGHMSIVTMPFADSKERLKEVTDNVLSRYMGKKMKLRLLSSIQGDAFRHLSPYFPNQKIVDDITMRIIPLETLVGGYPCTISTLRDDHGVYFARTPDRGVISLDVRCRGEDRNNGNGIVTGIPGVGKSTCLKHILESMYMQGFKIIVIDPEREFRDLCKHLDGSWWDAGGGGARVNIFELQAPVLDDEEDKRYKSDIPPLSQHIQYIQMILQYKIPSLTDIQISLLSRAMRELYERFGFTLESDFDPNRNPKDYPIMKDFYDYLKEKAQQDPRYDDLALLLEEMAIGADSFIWNGHTNIDLSNNLVVIDTNQLFGSSERNRATQYYNLMRMAFSAVSADRDTPYVVFADEAQIMLDPNLSQAAQALKNMALRVRKYEGYLWLAFHSLQELLDDRIRLYGQPILDSAAYKILFGTDGRNLADTVQLFHLTPSEEKALEARQRGKALALIGAHRLKVEFDIPAYKLELMGRGGGR